MLSKFDFKTTHTETFIPASGAKALQAVTHLGIGAHCDDLEIMAFHGIEKCFKNKDLLFGGVTVTDGRRSPRGADTQNLAVDEYIELRREEQAASKGKYGFQVFFNLESKELADLSQTLIDDFVQIFTEVRPDTVYTHNPFDKHTTHVNVCWHVIEALKKLPSEIRPRYIYGCEVWRSLDWLPDPFKICLGFPSSDLERELLAVYKSQVLPGKDYVEGTLGRRKANATFLETTELEKAEHVTFAVDLSPLVLENNRKSYFEKILKQFNEELMQGV